MRHILLTSTGFTNKNFERLFLDNVGKPVEQLRALFVPTAANDEESRNILPLCRQDLTDAGILDENIDTYDLDRPMDAIEIGLYDAIYFCGGSETYLMEAINKVNFGPVLLEAVNDGLFYIGVSAGSMIASSSVKGSLGIIPNPLEPHCEKNITPNGKLPPKNAPINLSDDQAVWITDTGAEIIQ